jgi:hypothetical protein
MLETTTTAITGNDGDRFAPVVGDRVVAHRDTLVELGRQTAGLPPTWFCIPAGTAGTLLGWRDRAEDTRAVVAVEQGDERVILFVSLENIVRDPGVPRARIAPLVPVARRRGPRRRH